MFKKLDLTKGKLTCIGVVAETENELLVLVCPQNSLPYPVHSNSVPGSKPYLSIKPVSTLEN
jgi:hypothetical protein